MRAHVVAGRVVGVADHDHARALGHARRSSRPCSANDRPGAGVRGQQRVERVRGPGHHELVAAPEQGQRRGLQQLGGAVAEHDLLGLDPVALGEQAPHRRGVAVRVAVDEAAGARDRRVDDLRVRQVGPLGAGQVEVGQPLQRQPLLAPRGARAARGSARPRRGRRTGGSSRGSPRRSVARGEGRPRALDDEEPEREDHGGDADARREDALERARAPGGGRRRGGRASRRGRPAWRRPS